MKVDSIAKNLRKHEEIVMKVKEREESRIRKHSELQQQQIDKCEQKAKKKAMLEEERVQYYREKDEELKKKIVQIKQYKSQGSVAEDDKRIEHLKEMEKICI